MNGQKKGHHELMSWVFDNTQLSPDLPKLVFQENHSGTVTWWLRNAATRLQWDWGYSHGRLHWRSCEQCSIWLWCLQEFDASNHVASAPMIESPIHETITSGMPLSALISTTKVYVWSSGIWPLSRSMSMLSSLGIRVMPKSRKKQQLYHFPPNVTKQMN